MWGGGGGGGGGEGRNKDGSLFIHDKHIPACRRLKIPEWNWSLNYFLDPTMVFLIDILPRN